MLGFKLAQCARVVSQNQVSQLHSGSSNVLQVQCSASCTCVVLTKNRVTHNHLGIVARRYELGLFFTSVHRALVTVDMHCCSFCRHHSHVSGKSAALNDDVEVCSLRLQVQRPSESLGTPDIHCVSSEVSHVASESVVSQVEQRGRLTIAWSWLVAEVNMQSSSVQPHVAVEPVVFDQNLVGPNSLQKHRADRGVLQEVLRHLVCRVVVQEMHGVAEAELELRVVDRQVQSLISLLTLDKVFKRRVHSHLVELLVVAENGGRRKCKVVLHCVVDELDWAVESVHGQNLASARQRAR